jgi:membrane protease YdiL (CAAX protease family)
MREFGGTDVYSLLGPYAAAVVLVSSVVGRPLPGALLAPSVRAVLWGVGCGAVMIAATYPTYAAASALLPALAPIVRSLYAATETPSLLVAMAWVSVIVLAEELLWRGVGLFELERKLGLYGASFVSVSSYALAQLGTGSWVVGLVALVCGALWTIERVYTGSVLAALITHWLWTSVVIVLCPLR